MTPNERAWLAMIRYAEGTAGYQNPYGTAFTGAQFNNGGGHPGTFRSSGRYRSDAHGAYQFLSNTWRMANGGRNVPMTPNNQDRAALWLIKRRGVDPTKPITPHDVAKLAPEWASLPTLAGRSYYGQPVRGYNELAGVWGQNNYKLAQPAPEASGMPVSVPQVDAPLTGPEAAFQPVQEAAQGVHSFVQDKVKTAGELIQEQAGKLGIDLF